MNTIAQRAIADYHRRGPGRLGVAPLEEDGIAGPPEHAVEAADALARALATLNDEHRRVVELWLQGYGAREVTGVSVDNFHQIVSRFRRTLRGQLDAGPKGEAA